MKRVIIILFVTALFGMPGITYSSLIDRGGGLIYDSDLNITWIQDANYAKSIGFDADGAMTWDVAHSWAGSVTYYDPVRKTTWSGWRLPTGSSPYSGYNITNDELGHLYYVELQNVAGSFTNSYLFINVMAEPIGSGKAYWSDTTATEDPFRAWSFFMGYGFRGGNYPTFEFYAWLVRDGDVGAAPVPIPAAIWFLGSGLVGLIGIRRLEKQSNNYQSHNFGRPGIFVFIMILVNCRFPCNSHLQ
jgi:hypothetical protein